MSDNIIVGLDIGTKNIRVVVAEKNEEGHLQITGIGVSDSTGMRKGIVTNIENTVQGINKAVDEAEVMSGVDIFHCTVGLGGVHIEGINSKGVFPISDKGKNNKEIDRSDIESVINSAKAVAIPMDRQIIHVVPQSYTVDKQHGIKDPLNMIGIRLEAEVHVITGAVTSIKNVPNCVVRANLNIDGLMHNGLADVRAVMTKDEQELGSILIDIGAGTTDIVVMQNGGPILTASLPVGGMQVTNDLAIVKNIPFDTAEKIKVSSGCCWMPFVESDEQVLIPGFGGRGPEEIYRSEICEILQARMAEIFVMVKNKVDTLVQGTHLGGSVVICGGGALLNGTTELADEIFGMQSARLGIPSTIGGVVGQYRSPEFAAVLGLILHSFDDQNKGGQVSNPRKENSGFVFSKIKDFIKELF
ncbi:MULTISPECIES: cell division protein FtsA [unclassified Treponema]|uniref:cell division protein FtsA n=1 Tax=unclassified Treponema TaxID=2638727 RepID=UPI0020A35A3D|nr:MULTISPECIES: cell division protein FtsA [unclassified Treponema]UTC65885.1 cell division protein FtsA [Treponema sp. OMZ 789]UTC68613.1 cell division protein FtsA [Treponema sp. OMZ 790]UTC71343.1 cell division protein FtsA [Treponema sp. OMZ 791]